MTRTFKLNIPELLNSLAFYLLNHHVTISNKGKCVQKKKYISSKENSPLLCKSIKETTPRKTISIDLCSKLHLKVTTDEQKQPTLQKPCCETKYIYREFGTWNSYLCLSYRTSIVHSKLS